MPLATSLPLDLPDEPSDVPADGTASDVPAGAPTGVYIALGVLAVAGLLTVNGPLTAASLITLAVLIRLLWRAGEPPVLLFAVGFQWLQVSAKIFHADLFRSYIDVLSPSPSIVEATWLSLASLVVLAVGIHLSLRRIPSMGVRIREGVEAFSISRAFWVYVGFSVVSVLISQFAYASAGLTQILLALVDLKWAAFFLLGYLVFSRGEGYAGFLIAFGSEFAQGIGFFSDFKTVFFVALLAALAARVTISGRTIALGIAGVVALAFIGSAWTVVKPAFRTEISEGGGMQTTSLGRSAQFQNLGRLLGELGPAELVLGLDPLFRRIAYTDYFALTMDFVPAHRPYDGGALWGEAVRHVLTPRILFPNKARLSSDSEVTMRYTGQYLASDAEGTSISIGYVGESYADFGPVGMFGVILLLGVGWGWAYGYFLKRSPVPLVGVAFSLVVLLGAYQFEMASIKLLGGVVMKFVVLALVTRWLGSRLIGWLSDEPSNEHAHGVDLVGVGPTAPA